MLRAKLLKEEMEEVLVELSRLTHLQEASTELKIEWMRALLKELCDLRYVTDGLAVSLGLPMEEAYREVHKSNMSKLDANGNPIYREDGKVLKSSRYEPPDMDKFVPLYEEADD